MLRPCPPFVRQAMWDAMPAEGPIIPNQETVFTNHAIIIAMVAYGDQEFPEGIRVRIRFGYGGNNHGGDYGVTCPLASNMKCVLPSVLVDVAAAAITVLIDGDEHPKVFRVCNVTL